MKVNIKLINAKCILITIAITCIVSKRFFYSGYKPLCLQAILKPLTKMYTPNSSSRYCLPTPVSQLRTRWNGSTCHPYNDNSEWTHAQSKEDWEMNLKNVTEDEISEKRVLKLFCSQAFRTSLLQGRTQQTRKLLQYTVWHICTVRTSLHDVSNIYWIQL